MSTSSTGSILPGSPMVNLGNLYVRGAGLIFLTGTTLTVSAGQVRDSTDSNDILVGGNLYSNPKVASADVTINTALTGVLGVDIGGGAAIVASTMYAVYVIGDSRGFNSGSAILSASFTLPSLPLGYDMYRYIGAVSMDGAKAVRKFSQTGAALDRTMWYDPGTDSTVLGVTIPSSRTTAVAANAFASAGVLTTLIPQSPVEVLLNVSYTANAAGDVIRFAPFGSTGSYASFSGVAAQLQNTVVRVPAALNATPVMDVVVATPAAIGALVITMNGYVDQL